MAEDEDRPRRRNSDSDFDGKPGGMRESRSYDRRYNQQGEDEYTNLPENANQLEIGFAEQEAERQAEELQRLRDEMDESRVQHWPHVGKFIIPLENTFAAHQQLVRGGRGFALDFDPVHYAEFDAILAEHANRPEIFDPSHADYPKYAQLRENLAIMRNDIMGMYMNDESFDPGDQRFVPLLKSVAAELGDAIRHDRSWFERMLFPRLDTELLNMEGDGAAYAYRFLQDRQHNEGYFASLIRDVRNLLKLPVREWELPPIEQTPFSPAGLDAPAPKLAHYTHYHGENFEPSIEQQHEPEHKFARNFERKQHHASWKERIDHERASGHEAGQHAGYV